jgi:integrase
MPVVALTPAFINTGLIVPDGKARIEYCDASCPGLLIEVRAVAGAVPVYYLRYKRNGKTAYDRLGTVRDLTLTQARKLATQKKVEYAPLAKVVPVVVPAVGEMTLDTFWAEHYFPFAKIHKRSWPKDESMYRLRIKPKFGASKLSEITRYQAQQFQNTLSGEKISPATNDHHLRLLKRFLSLAVQWEMLDKNVLARFPLLLVDNQVENYLDEAAMQRLVAVLQSYPNQIIASALMVLATTGMRYAEAFFGRWDEVNLENGTWRIGGDRNKSKRQKIVYLNDSAKQILQQVGTQGKSEYIFPNPGTGKPFTNIAKQWDTIRTLAKLSEKTRMHDLRHTFATRVLAAGRSLFEVQKLLFHADSKTTLRYSHISEQQLREAASAATVNLSIMPTPTSPAAVPIEVKTSSGNASPIDAPASNVMNFPKAA